MKRHFKLQRRVCRVAQERDESLVHSCVGVGAFVKLKVLFWPKTLEHKHKLLFLKYRFCVFMK